MEPVDDDMIGGSTYGEPGGKQSPRLGSPVLSDQSLAKNIPADPALEPRPPSDDLHSPPPNHSAIKHDAESTERDNLPSVAPKLRIILGRPKPETAASGPPYSCLSREVQAYISPPQATSNMLYSQRCEAERAIPSSSNSSATRIIKPEEKAISADRYACPRTPPTLYFGRSPCEITLESLDPATMPIMEFAVPVDTAVEDRAEVDPIELTPVSELCRTTKKSLEELQNFGQMHIPPSAQITRPSDPGISQSLLERQRFPSVAPRLLMSRKPPPDQGGDTADPSIEIERSLDGSLRLHGSDVKLCAVEEDLSTLLNACKSPSLLETSFLVSVPPELVNGGTILLESSTTSIDGWIRTVETVCPTRVIEPHSRSEVPPIKNDQEESNSMDPHVYPGGLGGQHMGKEYLPSVSPALRAVDWDRGENATQRATDVPQSSGTEPVTRTDGRDNCIDIIRKGELPSQSQDSVRLPQEAPQKETDLEDGSLRLQIPGLLAVEPEQPCSASAMVDDLINGAEPHLELPWPNTATNKADMMSKMRGMTDIAENGDLSDPTSCATDPPQDGSSGRPKTSMPDFLSSIVLDPTEELLMAETSSDAPILCHSNPMTVKRDGRDGSRSSIVLATPILSGEHSEPKAFLLAPQTIRTIPELVATDRGTAEPVHPKIEARAATAADASRFTHRSFPLAASSLNDGSSRERSVCARRLGDLAPRNNLASVPPVLRTYGSRRTSGNQLPRRRTGEEGPNLRFAGSCTEVVTEELDSLQTHSSPSHLVAGGAPANMACHMQAREETPIQTCMALALSADATYGAIATQREGNEELFRSEIIGQNVAASSAEEVPNPPAASSDLEIMSPARSITNPGLDLFDATFEPLEPENQTPLQVHIGRRHASERTSSVDCTDWPDQDLGPSVSHKKTKTVHWALELGASSLSSSEEPGRSLRTSPATMSSSLAPPRPRKSKITAFKPPSVIRWPSSPHEIRERLRSSSPAEPDSPTPVKRKAESANLRAEARSLKKLKTPFKSPCAQAVSKPSVDSACRLEHTSTMSQAVASIQDGPDFGSSPSMAQTKRLMTKRLAQACRSPAMNLSIRFSDDAGSSRFAAAGTRDPGQQSSKASEIAELERDLQMLRQAIKIVESPEDEEKLRDLIAQWRAAGREVVERLFAKIPEPEEQAVDIHVTTAYSSAGRFVAMARSTVSMEIDAAIRAQAAAETDEIGVEDSADEHDGSLDLTDMDDTRKRTMAKVRLALDPSEELDQLLADAAEDTHDDYPAYPVPGGQHPSAPKEAWDYAALMRSMQVDPDLFGYDAEEMDWLSI